MPKFLCSCGEVIRYSDIPCKIQYKFISDVKYDDYQGLIDSEKLYLDMESFLKCKNCKRLYVFWNGFGEDPAEYLLIPKKQ
jgi:hypothetical protein